MLERVAAGRPVPLFARSQREFNAVLDFVFARRPWIPGVARRHLARRATEHYALHNRIFADLFRDRPALEPVAPRILAPTLVIWGDRDRVLHPAGADVLERLLPRARAVRLPGIGHLPMLESPRRCAQLWLEFSGAAQPQAVPA
jgi:alpha/beta hydrolase fold.